jgi:hypothetical protein
MRMAGPSLFDIPDKIFSFVCHATSAQSRTGYMPSNENGKDQNEK